MEVNNLASEGKAYSTCDNGAGLCRGNDKAKAAQPSLPAGARLPINRCNLPAVILGSLTFQKHPAPLKLDGVEELNHALFERLDRLTLPHHRAEAFDIYMETAFRLCHLDEAGLSGNKAKGRAKANWRRIVRGWAFDPDGREAAVLKGWVESRFGLTPRHHREPLRDPSSAAYSRYMEMRTQGIYGTNALESQLDLMYAYCQYEFARQAPTQTHLRLFRGVNRLDAFEELEDCSPREAGDRCGAVLLNNINSFSRNRERAGEFGDYILVTNVPVAKVIFHSALLPGVLQGEDEMLVVGGAYEVAWTTF